LPRDAFFQSPNCKNALAHCEDDIRNLTSVTLAKSIISNLPPTVNVSQFAHDLFLLFKLHHICSLNFNEND